MALSSDDQIWFVVNDNEPEQDDNKDHLPTYLYVQKILKKDYCFLLTIVGIC